MLICKFASQSSRPEKIQDWIAYLENLTQKHNQDADAQRTLEQLLDEARNWAREISYA
jgi:small-conductance mechanosensitive channel